MFKSGAGSSGSWEVVTAGVSNSEVNGKTLYTVQVTNAGMWGLAQRTKNSAAGTSSALFFVMLTMIILFS